MRILLALSALLLVLGLSGTAPSPVHTFTLGNNQFLLDGQPLQLISGELHYPRIPREAWRARLKMAKAMGLNTIGTYVFWNVHEPQPGQYDFTGNNDVAAFVRMAQEEGLWVVLRPSPYVCAEWEFGGYPYWLQNINGLKVRSLEPQYVAAYQRYLQAVGRQLAPLQVNHGGPVLMVQVENEYGSYGADKEYLAQNKKMFEQAGFDGLLYTCDPAPDVAKGHLPGLLPAVNGVDKPSRIRQLVHANHDGQGPYYVAEWYPAWFDWWGTAHHTVPAARYTPGLDSVLRAGMSINMYMFHGGTTRGFMNGANYKGDSSHYEPQISSYDYDAPLDEAGNPTAKFRAFREVIARYRPAGASPLPPVPAAKPSAALPPVQLTRSVSLLARLPQPVASAQPLTFEALKQPYGFVLYRTTVAGGGRQLLKLRDLRDYAVVLVNGQRVGTLDRRQRQDSLLVQLPAGKVQLDILVENLGRINFGKYLLQNTKGITKRVLLGGREVTGWQMFGLPFASAPAVAASAGPAASSGPVLRAGSFMLAQPQDTYLDMRQWGKGVVWVNGHNLGRYWAIGPQQTLYVPAEWLRKGQNEVTVLELLKPRQRTLVGLDHPILSELQPGPRVSMSE
ncbi:MAG: beta-galactosidase [Janthinobacterium lividum]